nr:unnamed protein product [Callosobruchus analis]
MGSIASRHDTYTTSGAQSTTTNLASEESADNHTNDLASEEQSGINDNSDNYSENDDMNFSDSSISSEGNSQTSHFLSNETDRKLNLNDEIQGWAITHQITQVALNDLLNILRKLDNTFPCDSRSLLRTPRHVKKQLKAVNPGYYYHFGLQSEHSNGPFCEVEGTQFQQANFDNFIIKTSEADNCCALKNGSIICVSNFIKNANGIFVLGKKFDSVKDFYTVPCKSSTFNIYLVDSLGVFDIWNLKEINYKCVRLPYGSKWVIFPLLHLDKTDANVIV